MENIYVDYDYYVNDFGGINITSENDFNKMAISESKYLDKATFYNLVDLVLSDDEEKIVKNCMCELIEYSNKYKSVIIPNGIASESVQGFSRSYLSPEDFSRQEKINEIRKRKIVTDSFGNTTLHDCIFRGKL